MQSDDVESRALFLQFKSICVPLLGLSRLDPRSIPKVLDLLSDLADKLQKLKDDRVELKPALISYIFFPLSTILGRHNAPPSSMPPPDQVLERIFRVLEILVSAWWCSTLETGVWEQLVKLAALVIVRDAGRASDKGKGRERDEETREAAVRLLLALLRAFLSFEDPSAGSKARGGAPEGEERRCSRRVRVEGLKSFARSEKMVPVLGRTLNALLETAAAADGLSLRVSSLQAVEVIIGDCLPEGVIPSILPGTASTVTRVALCMAHEHPRMDRSKSKGWAHSSLVAASLRVLDVVVIRSIGDEPCLAAGVVKEVRELEDLAELVIGDGEAEVANVSGASSSSSPESHQPYETRRSSSWLRASSAQLLIALSSLRPLVAHPTPAALVAFSSLALSILSRARLSLADARPLLLSVLLTLSNSHFTSVSSHARDALNTLLSPSSKGSYDVLQTLIRRTTEALTSIPRLLPSRADAELMHVAGQVEAVCRLKAATSGVGQLLGSTGHIEKWGWRFLSMLNFAPPASAVAAAAGAEIFGLLESAEQDQIVFPEALLRDISTRETQVALERMLRALGSAGGDSCLYSVEWFVRVGSAENNGPNAAGALWCACRILEGIAGMSLDSHDSSLDRQPSGRSRQIEKLARWITRHVSELWDEQDEVEDSSANEVRAAYDAGNIDDDEETARPLIEYHKGLTEQLYVMPVDLLASPARGGSASEQNNRLAPAGLQRAYALQLISISAAVLQARFSALLLYAIYPILHSLVVADRHLSGTAISALQFVTRQVGFATPGNLLLSNFDYALDALSRRLSRRWLDLDAAKVLVILVRLVGKDIVQRAGDVVEECFNRLDEYHGYTVVVEGLVEALLEVVKVIEEESDEVLPDPTSGLAMPDDEPRIPDSERFGGLLRWIADRKKDRIDQEELEAEEFGPAPRKAWGKGKEREPSQDEGAHVKPHDDDASTGPLDEQPPTPTQTLTAQIVARSITLLTHGSPAIRTRILNLLAAAAPVLPASALLPSVHRAWPFIVNRLADSETRHTHAIVAAAAGLVAALAQAHGPFMTQRVWEDVWPRFRAMLDALDSTDQTSALAAGTRGGTWARVGTQSAYTHSHRLYRAMLHTMTAAARGRGGSQTVVVQDRYAWDVLFAFRRFLHAGAHEELQGSARQLYEAFVERKDADVVWLVLTSTASVEGVPHVEHLKQQQWDIEANVKVILGQRLDGVCNK